MFCHSVSKIARICNSGMSRASRRDPPNPDQKNRRQSRDLRRSFQSDLRRSFQSDLRRSFQGRLCRVKSGVQNQSANYTPKGLNLQEPDARALRQQTQHLWHN
jgi:hypothetical protein